MCNKTLIGVCTYITLLLEVGSAGLALLLLALALLQESLRDKDFILGGDGPKSPRRHMSEWCGEHKLCLFDTPRRGTAAGAAFPTGDFDPMDRRRGAGNAVWNIHRDMCKSVANLQLVDHSHFQRASTDSVSRKVFRIRKKTSSIQDRAISAFGSRTIASDSPKQSISTKH